MPRKPYIPSLRTRGSLTPGLLANPREHLAMSGDMFWLSQLRWGATGINWIEARDAAKHLIAHRTGPHNKEVSDPLPVYQYNILEFCLTLMFWPRISGCQLGLNLMCWSDCRASDIWGACIPFNVHFIYNHS